MHQCKHGENSHGKRIWIDLSILRSSENSWCISVASGATIKNQGMNCENSRNWLHQSINQSQAINKAVEAAWIKCKKFKKKFFHKNTISTKQYFVKAVFCALNIYEERSWIGELFIFSISISGSSYGIFSDFLTFPTKKTRQWEKTNHW